MSNGIIIKTLIVHDIEAEIIIIIIHNAMSPFLGKPINSLHFLV